MGLWLVINANPCVSFIRVFLGLCCGPVPLSPVACHTQHFWSRSLTWYCIYIYIQFYQNLLPVFMSDRTVLCSCRTASFIVMLFALSRKPTWSLTNWGSCSIPMVSISMVDIFYFWMNFPLRFHDESVGRAIEYELEKSFVALIRELLL